MLKNWTYELRITKLSFSKFSLTDIKDSTPRFHPTSSQIDLNQKTRRNHSRFAIQLNSICSSIMALSVDSKGGVPAKYDTFSRQESGSESWSESLLSAALTKMDFGKGETILDFGCGSGKITTKYLAPLAEKHGSKLFAVDNSIEQIEFARENNSHPNVYYIHGDITSKQFPLTGVRFNKIICHMVLEQIPDYGKLVTDLVKLLKPSGTLWVLTTSDKGIFRCINNLKGQAKFSPYLDEVSVPDWVREDGNAESYYARALQKENLNVNGMTTRRSFLTFEEFRDVVEAQVCAKPGLPKMAPNLLEEFNDLLRKEFTIWKGKEAEFQLLMFYVRN